MGLASCLELVESVDQLVTLMGSCVRKEGYSEVNQIGSKCLDLIIAQQKVDKEFQETRIALEFKYKQLVNEGNDVPPFEPPIPDYHSYNYEKKKQEVCSIMLNA